ncbi:hypothetical protein ABVT39_018766 [Epinephelus coioides]
MKIRSKDWWDRVVLTEFSDVEWKEIFRMMRQPFLKLCSLVEGFMAPDEVTVRAPIPLTMRVAVVLYQLGRCGEYHLVANQFGIHKATVKKITYMFCKGVVRGLLRDLIRMPNEEEALEIARRFEASHYIPQIMGLIDGTHIPIHPPSDGYRDSVNRKGWPSYVLEAVVDDRFWNIEGEDVQLQIIGDPAYPLLDWLIKGYLTSPNLTPEQESFNVYLSSARVGVEMAFGLIKSWWRVLQKRSEFHFTFAPKMIATYCALHNYCQKKNDVGNNNWLEGIDPVIYPQPNQPVHRGFGANDSRARYALTRYMARH